MVNGVTNTWSSSLATVLGYPRQGPDRELKRAIEAYWAGRTDCDALLRSARELRSDRLAELASADLDELPSNEFSLYDHVLDTAWMVGAIPARHRGAVPDISTPAGRVSRYFAMARGTAEVAPMEMTKWFDTNYHYLVPELGPDTRFTLDASKPLQEFCEAAQAGIITRPVILGPISFLLLAKAEVETAPGFAPLALLERLVPVYVELLGQLHAAGAQWVQLDEPALVTDQPPAVLDALRRTYATLTTATGRPKILLASYFGHLGDALPVLAASAVEGLALDFTGAAAANLDELVGVGGIPGKRLVAGVVDGRNVWLTDLERALSTLATLRGLAARVDVSSSCSLLHVPLDLTLERGLDPEVGEWLCFARQKLDEIVTLSRGLREGLDTISPVLRTNTARRASRTRSPLVHNDAVRARAAAATDAELHRASAYGSRKRAQHDRLQLPVLPTTTIGSFPQTPNLRTARAALRNGTLDRHDYDEAMRTEIAAVIALQSELGVDVLVHGEPERNDMVQYFAEQLTGFLATTHGWVQSYGSRYVRPPIIVGDVARPTPMTVRWAEYAQSLTTRPVKGMLTGPVTMLAWSFVRDDQPQADTARQVALALREEVGDLESAGICVIQVDEPALRETLPLREVDRPDYLRWAVESFQLCTAGVRDDTQIHTHMCYADFGDILGAITAMDADVVSLEAARSDMTIVSDLSRAAYAQEVGPGVWDIHSPRVPSTTEIEQRLRAAVAVFPPERLWVNPDCGLKTRGYPEVRASMANLVAAAATVRASL